MERYYEGRWIFDDITGELVHIKGHNRSDGTILDRNQLDIIVPPHLISELVEILSKKGFIKPVFVNEARQEDLKITHRLLDIMEKNIKVGD